jgi:hypothetical protein
MRALAALAAEGVPSDSLLPEGYDVLWAVWILVVAIIPVVLFIAALVSILRSIRYTGGGKLLWIVVVLLAPFLGPLGWFLAGRRAQIRTNAP